MDFGEITPYKKQIINIGIIGLFLIVGVNIYRIQSIEADRLRQEQEKEIKNNAILRRIQELDKRLTYYKDFANKKELAAVMNKLSRLAKDSGVTVRSIRPLVEERGVVSLEYPYQLSIDAEDYGAIGRFISAVESDRDIYIIRSIRIAVSQDISFSAGKESKPGITGDLQLSTIIFN